MVTSPSHHPGYAAMVKKAIKNDAETEEDILKYAVKEYNLDEDKAGKYVARALEKSVESGDILKKTKDKKIGKGKNKKNSSVTVYSVPPRKRRSSPASPTPKKAAATPKKTTTPVASPKSEKKSAAKAASTSKPAMPTAPVTFKPGAPIGPNPVFGKNGSIFDVCTIC